MSSLASAYNCSTVPRCSIFGGGLGLAELQPASSRASGNAEALARRHGPRCGHGQRAGRSGARAGRCSACDYREPPLRRRPAERDERRRRRPDASSADDARRSLRRRTPTTACAWTRCWCALAPEFSRSHLQSLVERGHVRSTARAGPAPSRRLRAGQRLAVDLVPTDESRAFRAAGRWRWTCVYEDDAPAGARQAGRPGRAPGARQLVGHACSTACWRATRAPRALPRAGIVHRLDKDTSGLMVVGKTLPAVTALSRAIAERARAAALPGAGAWPGRAAPSSQRRGADRPRPGVARAHGRGGRRQAGAHRCAAAWRSATASARCAARCTRGRTHQIRVHLACARSPAGGRRASTAARRRWACSGRRCTPRRLVLPHPVTRRGRWPSTARRRPTSQRPGLAVARPDSAERRCADAVQCVRYALQRRTGDRCTVPAAACEQRPPTALDPQWRAVGRSEHRPRARLATAACRGRGPDRSGTAAPWPAP